MFYKVTLVLTFFLVSVFSPSTYAQHGDGTVSIMTSATGASTTGTSFSPMYNNMVMRHPMFGNISAIYAEVQNGKTHVRLFGESGATIFTGVTMLAGANQPPSVLSNATGTGIFVLDTWNNTLSYNITFSGLGSNETSAHIHGPTDSMGSAGILWTLPVWPHKVGVWNYSQDQEENIISGKMYVNVHSVNYPNGEIRGQIYVPCGFTLNTANVPSILNGIANKLDTNTTIIQPFVLFRFIDLAKTSDVYSNFREAIKERLVILRQSYFWVFNSISRRLDNISDNKKIPILTKLIDQIDMKVAQIKQSDRELSNKQDLILLYGDLRLMVQKKLLDLGNMTRIVHTEDDILEDAASAQ